MSEYHQQRRGKERGRWQHLHKSPAAGESAIFYQRLKRLAGQGQDLLTCILGHASRISGELEPSVKKAYALARALGKSSSRGLTQSHCATQCVPKLRDTASTQFTTSSCHEALRATRRRNRGQKPWILKQYAQCLLGYGPKSNETTLCIRAVRPYSDLIWLYENKGSDAKAGRRFRAGLPAVKLARLAAVCRPDGLRLCLTLMPPQPTRLPFSLHSCSSEVRHLPLCKPSIFQPSGAPLIQASPLGTLTVPQRSIKTSRR